MSKKENKEKIRIYHEIVIFNCRNRKGETPFLKEFYNMLSLNLLVFSPSLGFLKMNKMFIECH